MISPHTTWMSAAMSGRSRLENEVKTLSKKLADTERSVQRSKRDKESFLVNKNLNCNEIVDNR